MERRLNPPPINTSIVERSYQHEAIRRVAEAFAANKRRALLVMATGTGKTRTTMALIDVFLRTQPGAERSLPRRPRRPGRSGPDRWLQSPPAA